MPPLIMYEPQDYFITGFFLLVIIAAWGIMRASAKADKDLLDQEDEEDNSISGDIINMKYVEGGIEDEGILGKTHEN